MEYDVNETITFGIISWIDRYKQHVKRFCWCCGCHYCYYYCMCGCCHCCYFSYLFWVLQRMQKKNTHIHSKYQQTPLAYTCIYIYRYIYIYALRDYTIPPRLFIEHLWGVSLSFGPVVFQFFDFRVSVRGCSFLFFPNFFHHSLPFQSHVHGAHW